MTIKAMTRSDEKGLQFGNLFSCQVGHGDWQPFCVENWPKKISPQGENRVARVGLMMKVFEVELIETHGHTNYNDHGCGSSSSISWFLNGSPLKPLLTHLNAAKTLIGWFIYSLCFVFSSVIVVALVSLSSFIHLFIHLTCLRQLCSLSELGWES